MTLEELAIKYNWSPEELERQRSLVPPSSGIQRMVKDLKVGDILTSGDIVIGPPFDSIRCPRTHCNICIQYVSGVRALRQWNKRTIVSIKKPKIYEPDLH